MAPGGEAKVRASALAALRRVSGYREASWEGPWERLRGGSWADTYKVRVGGIPGLDGPLVLRVLPVGDRWETEFRIHAHAAQTGFRAPRVHFGAPAGEEFPRAWILMDYIDGTQIVSEPTSARFIAALLKRLGDSPALLARAAVAVHRIDPGGIQHQLALPASVAPSLDWLYSRATALEDAGLIERAERLLASRPAFRGAVLCHGDLHPLNIIRTAEGDWLIDWTHATFDDPLYDVAFTHMVFHYVPLPVPRAARPFVALASRGLAARYLAAYEHASGDHVDHDRLRWYERLVALRILVEVAETVKNGPRTTDPGAPQATYWAELLRASGF